MRKFNTGRIPFYGDHPFLIPMSALCTIDVAAACDGLLRFDAEVPHELRPAWTFNVPRDPEYDEPDDGIIEKHGVNRKVYLHYRADLQQLLDKRGIVLTNWQREWLESCGHLYSVCMNSMRRLAVILDALWPGFDFAKRESRYRSQHVLRVLKYDPSQSQLAKAHSDRSAITFRIAESHPGFYAMEGWNRRFYDAPTTPEVDCFAGDQLERITRGGIRRVWHGADDSTGGAEARFAVVFFGKMYPGNL